MTEQVASTQDFQHTILPSTGKKIFRLGLATNMGIDADGIREALEQINYIYWTPRARKAAPAVIEALRRDREHYVLATGPTTAFWGSNIRSFTHKTLKQLGTDYIDILQIHWLSRMSAWTDSTREALVRLKEEGKVRAIGVSIHDRERAGKLAAEGVLDHFMIRYNAAHPGAERDIFPHLNREKQSVQAYTATRWRKLLKRPKGWEGRVPTAGDCYRFCLSSPSVDVVLTGPKSTEQLRENLAAMEKGPLVGQELEWIRDFGKVVHG